VLNNYSSVIPTDPELAEGEWRNRFKMVKALRLNNLEGIPLLRYASLGMTINNYSTV